MLYFIPFHSGCGGNAGAGYRPDEMLRCCSCPSPGQALYGQDANYHSIYPMSFTKLDGSGNALPDSAKSWVTVKDNVTGLVWEMKTNKDRVKNYNDPHDADNTYTWYPEFPYFCT